MVAWKSSAIGVLVFVVATCNSQSPYTIPEVKFEALKGGGFRAFIPDLPKTNLFAFHGNVNDDISPQTQGTVTQEAKSATNGYWVVTFPTKLKVGDVVNYWVFINNNNLGYRRDPLSWKVRELLDSYSIQASRCDTGATVINRGKTTCLNQVIIDDQFNGPVINPTTWTEEHFIPTYSEPNFEFNSYESKDDTRFFRNGMLYLKPIPKTEDKVRGILNLRNGCTSNQDIKCYHEHKSSFLLPPVKSARITSQTSFRYGKVEIRAKLPAGDWIFPIIQLEPKLDEDDNSAKIWIAYSRGNNYLFGSGATDIDVRGTGRDDIGSRLLFAGPVLHPTEPGRSKKLVSERSSSSPYNADFHVYTLNWVPGRMTFFIDSREVGSVNLRSSFADPSLGIGDKWNTPEAPFDKEYVLSLGVGVGGLNDFPDGYTSGNNIHKPWVNGDRNYVKTFFDAKDVWSRTWNGDNSALQIDYVKVTAV